MFTCSVVDWAAAAALAGAALVLAAGVLVVSLTSSVFTSSTVAPVFVYESAEDAVAAGALAGFFLASAAAFYWF